MATAVLNTVMVGGGHGGCNLACFIEEANKANPDSPPRTYVVLERGPRPLEKWRSGRWNHFQLNTPARFSRLHGQEDDVADDVLDRPIAQDLKLWDDHLQKMGVHAHVRCNTTVTKVTTTDDDHFITTAVDAATGKTVAFRSRNVVVSSGAYGNVAVPKALSEALPKSVNQHTSQGFVDTKLGDGAVLIVGSGQSGCQLAHLLTAPDATVKRDVYLCTGKSGGVCRSYKGEDLFVWLDRMKFLTMPKEALLGMPAAKAQGLRYSHPPVTGPCHELSPFTLHRQGVHLLGRLTAVEGSKLSLAERASQLKHILASTEGLNGTLNEFVKKWVKDHDGEDWDAPPAPEWTLQPDEQHLIEDPGPAELDLEATGITDVVWATGYSFDLSYLVDNVPQIAEELEGRYGHPTELVSKVVRGLFFTGFPWLNIQQSSNLVGMEADHAKILANLRGEPGAVPASGDGGTTECRGAPMDPRVAL